MSDFAVLRADRRGFLVQDADRIVAWRVRWKIFDKTYQRDFEFEVEATDFYNRFDEAKIECDLEPLWGWEYRTRGGINGRAFSASECNYKLVWKVNGEQVSSGPVYQDKDLAEDAACQMRLAGLDAYVVKQS